MRYLNELSNLYLELLNEDLQSSLNQARNILVNNGIEDTDSWLGQIKVLYDLVHFENEQNRVAHKDTNIPALAYWLASGTNIGTIDDDYNQYINTPSLYQRNYLINAVEELKNEIKTRKLFKPSEEKKRLIRDKFIDISQTIHAAYVPPETKEKNKEKFTRGQRDENVVYEDEDVLVYRADSKKKCIQYGAGSNLCISTRGGGNYYWSYRMGNQRTDDLGMTTYFVVFKNEKYPDGRNKTILVDSLGNEDGPANEYSWNPIFNWNTGRNQNHDSDVDADELIGYHPELEEPFKAGAFKFMPYTEEEERFKMYEDMAQRNPWITVPTSSRLTGYAYKINDRITNLRDLEMAIEAGMIMPRKQTAWDTIEKAYPRDINDIFKKYSFLNTDDRDGLPVWSAVRKYLTPSDINRYIDEIDEEMYEIPLQEYYTNSLIENPDDDILINKIFEHPLSNERKQTYLYKLVESGGGKHGKIGNKVARKLAPQIYNYLNQIPEFDPQIDDERDPDFDVSLFKTPIRYNDWVPDNLFHEILKTPGGALAYITKVFRVYNKEKERWQTYDPKKPDHKQYAKYADRFDKLLDVITSGRGLIRNYLLDINRTGIPDRIWEIIKNDEKLLAELRDDLSMNNVSDDTWNDLVDQGWDAMYNAHRMKLFGKDFDRLFDSVQRLHGPIIG